MIKQFTITVGLLLSLSVSVAENATISSALKRIVIDDHSASTDISSRATVQVASLWVEQGKVNTSSQLARPL